MKTTPSVLFLGDSLTYGFMVPATDSMPQRIQRRLKEAGWSWHVINGGVSGDTVEMASHRVDAYFTGRRDVRLMVVFLGANDLLMGEDPSRVREDFLRLFKKARQLAPGLRIRLVALGALPLSDAEYQKAFLAIFPGLAEQTDGALIPFPLADVVGRPDKILGDGLHPNSEGYRVMSDALWPFIEGEFRSL